MDLFYKILNLRLLIGIQVSIPTVSECSACNPNDAYSGFLNWDVSDTGIAAYELS
jgi:hypothetical protein